MTVKIVTDTETDTETQSKCSINSIDYICHKTQQDHFFRALVHNNQGSDDEVAEEDNYYGAVNIDNKYQNSVQSAGHNAPKDMDNILSNLKSELDGKYWTGFLDGTSNL